jgi:hypothetical protein
MCSLGRGRSLALIGVALALGAVVSSVPAQPAYAQQGTERHEPSVEPPVVRPTRPDLNDRGFEHDWGDSGSDEIGEVVGDEVSALSTALLFSVALLVGIGALAKRDLGQAVVIMVVVLVVGGFVLAPAAVQDLVENIADSMSFGSAG